jgi:cytochrome c oxidase assembly protein subunit 15
MELKDSSSSSRPVAIWMYTGVFMLLIQFILGGVTRLTGSGLSITEWNVLSGSLPPLNHTQWLEAFEKYKQTPQFRILNSDFALSDFKFIFFWEFTHRLWARLVGVVFLIGFVYFIAKKQLSRDMIRPMIILFILGGLQGAVGWIMVASGLTGDAIYVVPTRLALHFVFACGLILYTFWFALILSVRPGDRGTRSARNSKPLTIAILIILFLQLTYGALMAGHKAATVAPTWPDINGQIIPAGLFGGHSFSDILLGNTITVQFIHRAFAYLLILLVAIWTFKAYKIPQPKPLWRKFRNLPLFLILLQALLGITSLLTSPGIAPNHWVLFNWLAEFHQIVGLLFLLTITGMLYLEG